MAKRVYVSQFFADDKDIKDVLASEKRGIPTRRLLQLARERGIFLSESEDRETLVQYVSCLQFDWHLLTRLFDMTEREDRAEKKTSSTLAAHASVGDVADVAQVIQKDREKLCGEAYAIKQNGNVLTIEVSYTEVDESRTRLNQRRSRKLTIQAECTPEGIKFRHEANERAESIVAELVEHLADDEEAPPPRKTIALSGLRDPNVRTQFFLDLMRGVPGCTLRDVSSVSVDRVPADAEPEVAEDGEEASEELATSGESTPYDAEMTAVVRHVLLRGDSLLDAQEYEDLRKAGFFISRAVWAVEEMKKDGCKVEYEAEFDDGPNATGFRYGVRGVYERNKQGDFKKTRRTISDFDKQPLLEALEGAAQRALATAEGKAAKPLLAPPPSAQSKAS